MIIVITGPTAVGKTKMSVALAKILNGEIVNADAMQVYQGLNIGTAKVTEAEKEEIPHHLFDVASPTRNYTVYDYQKDARHVIDSILANNKIPILVGGTGLYIKAALYNYHFDPEGESNEYKGMSNEELLERIAAYNIPIDFDTKNRRRLVRALNKLENNTYNTFKANQQVYNDIIFIGLTTDREILYQKINERVFKMFNDGLLEEVEAFHHQNLRTKALMTGIGYKEIYQYLDGNITKEECIDLIQKNSRHYAKRQYTFFNHQLPIKWFEVDYENFSSTINSVLEYIKISLKG